MRERQIIFPYAVLSLMAMRFSGAFVAMLVGGRKSSSRSISSHSFNSIDFRDSFILNLWHMIIYWPQKRKRGRGRDSQLLTLLVCPNVGCVMSIDHLAHETGGSGGRALWIGGPPVARSSPIVAVVFFLRSSFIYLEINEQLFSFSLSLSHFFP